jgi:peptidoglycan/LPS O-acetylase OafA/YrhL
MDLGERLLSSRPERYAELDGVRGIAIALTIAENTLMVRGPGWGEDIWGILATGCWIGVQLFFVLSGFLITGILIDSKGDRAYFRNFFARRALRILPLYVVVLGIISIGLLVTGRDPPHNLLCYWLFVSNFCIAHAGYWGWGGYLGVMWSLAVEEHFYLFWPLLVAFLAPPRLLRATCLILVASLLLRYLMTAYGASSLAIYTITPTRLDGLAAGALAAMAIRSTIAGDILAKAATYMLLAGLGVMISTAIAAGSFDHHGHWTVRTVGYTAATVAGAGLVLLVTAERDPHNRIRRMMRWRPLVAFGFYSYAMYLLHSIVHLLLAKLPPFRSDALSDFPGGALLAQLIIAGLVAAGAFAAALISYRLLEKPFLDLRRHFPRRPQRGDVAAAR